LVDEFIIQLVVYNGGFEFMFSILALLFFPLLLWRLVQVVVVIASVWPMSRRRTNNPSLIILSIQHVVNCCKIFETFLSPLVYA
jgi:hypothetical protein